jgi:hypothetical protein
VGDPPLSSLGHGYWQSARVGVRRFLRVSQSRPQPTGDANDRVSSGATDGVRERAGTAPWSPPSTRDDIAFAAYVALVALFLLLRLGHYPLWEDEALTALAAKAVTRTGDTSAVVDNNIVAFRDGLLLYGLRDRSTPPLPAYLTALSFALGGENAFAARLPFAACGLLTAVSMAWLARAYAATLLPATLVMVGVACNASLFLYSRQSRYYAVAMAATVLIGHLYFRHRLRGRYGLFAGLCTVALFACHYITCLAVLCCIACDYLFWGRHAQRLQARSVAGALAPLALCVPIGLVWNPFLTQFGAYTEKNGLWERAVLWAWHWRDLNRCEFFSAGLLLGAVFLAVRQRDALLARGLVALVVLVTVTSAVSPQPVRETAVADVRYVTPAIPLGVAIGVRVILLVAQFRPRPALAFAAIAFGTNLLNGAALMPDTARSTIVWYAYELVRPADDPYSPTIEWIQEHVDANSSVWVLPDYMVYPLMFHAPAPTYAWQLATAEGQFADVAEVHLRGKVPPQVVVAFGPVAGAFDALRREWARDGLEYERVASLLRHWEPLYRPELFWRSFTTVPYVPDTGDGIQIYRRVR